MLLEKVNPVFKHNPKGERIAHREYSNVSAVVTFYLEKSNERRFVFFRWSNPDQRRYTPCIWPEWRFHRHFLTDGFTAP